MWQQGSSVHEQMCLLRPQDELKCWGVKSWEEKICCCLLMLWFRGEKRSLCSFFTMHWIKEMPDSDNAPKLQIPQKDRERGQAGISSYSSMRSSLQGQAEVQLQTAVPVAGWGALQAGVLPARCHSTAGCSKHFQGLSVVLVVWCIWSCKPETIWTHKLPEEQNQSSSSSFGWKVASRSSVQIQK